MYLFDTDIIANIFKKQPSPGLLARLAKTPQSAQHISTIAISRKLVLVSGNSRHFSRIPELAWENWLE